MQTYRQLAVACLCLPWMAATGNAAEGYKPIQSLDELSWMLGDWQKLGAAESSGLTWRRNLGGKALVAEYANAPEADTPTAMLSVVMQKPGGETLVAYTFDQKGGIAVSDLVKNSGSIRWLGTKTFADGTSGRGGIELTIRSDTEYTARYFFLDGEAVNYMGEAATMVRSSQPKPD
ncbi:hypothetical protein [Botrimarina hoheduenensis]|uniref:DUF1579 domain-containing protein n=1 Tax=Botrimarina hoheduenensis TaxID=2528000 RepID=A0A5C5WFU3_9BACT|nr:hypothetical protein [Botrimarina hoheduenensis]TWT48959.1 hypothetical protein Pla111_07370 [Botrimarina hoheduenensis]